MGRPSGSEKCVLTVLALLAPLLSLNCMGEIESPQTRQHQNYVDTCTECSDVGAFASGAIGDNLCPCGWGPVDGGIPDGGTDEPEEPPANWMCDDLFYEDGLCDCGCRAADPDCDGEGCTDLGCRAEGCEVCNGHACTPIPEDYQPTCCSSSADAGVPDGGSCEEEWLCDPVEDCVNHCETIELFDADCACPACQDSLPCCP